MKPFLLVGVLALGGCSLFNPTNESRVTEGRIGGIYGALTGDAKMVRLVKEGDIQGCLEYHGEQATYRSPGCAALPSLTTTTTTTVSPAQPEGPTPLLPERMSTP